MAMFICARCDELRDSDDGCEEAPAALYSPPYQLLCAECVSEIEDLHQAEIADRHFDEYERRHA